MVKNSKICKAFSIVEALVASTILVVVLVFGLRSSTKKQKEPDSPFRGVYRCECHNNQLSSFYIVNGERKDPEIGMARCRFFPQIGINLYTVKVWNTFSQNSNNKDTARNYAITSFPDRKGTEISLGNAHNPDIYIKDALYINDLASESRCILDSFPEQDVCEASGIGSWNDGCFLIVGDSAHIKEECEAAAGRFYDNEQSNNCQDGVTLEITW